MPDDTSGYMLALHNGTIHPTAIPGAEVDEYLTRATGETYARVTFTDGRGERLTGDAWLRELFVVPATA